MSEEKFLENRKQKTENRKIYPEPTVGPIIYNKKGEILLIQSNKWGDFWHIPGGHIEMGETSEEALKREIKEETGLEIDNIEFIGWQDAIYPKAFFEKKHFIFLNFCAKLAGGKITKSDEMEEYIWIKPREALKKLKIDSYTIKTIQFYLKHKEGKEADYSEKYKRALADYQNLVKQTAKEKQEFAKFANEQLLYEILPVYDNLRLALKHAKETPNNVNIRDGVKYILKQFKDSLNNLGVEEIKTSGMKFDHNTMEAVEGKGDKVKQEVRPGYKLNGKVIVVAKVILK
ncbi:nucleotide exchange factor GrpE [Candidatus Parcubacteria bacterium]|nr:nucleotide exchange factor GrpE [Candidatus Parcubacteria bacterium]